MFMLATLIFLLIAAWLFFNGINEKRWVDAHRHDETVAADPGLLPRMSRIIGRGDGTSMAEQSAVRLKVVAADARMRLADISAGLRQRAADEHDTLGKVIARTRKGTGRAVDTGNRMSRQAAAKGNELRDKVRQRLSR